eukprot:6183771-Pleurochrysis_carterae.AAC.1
MKRARQRAAQGNGSQQISLAGCSARLRAACTPSLYCWDIGCTEKSCRVVHCFLLKLAPASSVLSWDSIMCWQSCAQCFTRAQLLHMSVSLISSRGAYTKQRPSNESAFVRTINAGRRCREILLASDTMKGCYAANWMRGQARSLIILLPISSLLEAPCFSAWSLLHYFLPRTSPV